MEARARPVPITFRRRIACVEREPLRRLARRVLDREGAAEGAGVGLVLAGDRLVRRLNREWRGLDRTTDVLSFPSPIGPPLPPGEADSEDRLLGEVVISLPRCLEQARSQGVAPGTELVRLFIHGILHVLGYDHERERDRLRMTPRERAHRTWSARNGIGPSLIVDAGGQKLGIDG